MNPHSTEDDLSTIRSEHDALDQSIALNRIVMKMLQDSQRKDLWLRVVLIISILSNIVISGIFIAYESQFTTTTTTTTTTIEQDTGEGWGNNIYQAGEYAEYTQEGVSTDAQAADNYSDGHSDENPQ